MIGTQNKDVSSVRLDGKDFIELRAGSSLVWQAANFITADGKTIRTADGYIFNCKNK